jgi:hypothetical protein
MVSTDVMEWLDKWAAEEGTTRSAIARRLLLEKLRELEEDLSEHEERYDAK